MISSSERKVAVVDMGGANHASVINAFQRLGVVATLARSVADLEKADRVVLPGVGHAGACMKNLESLDLVKYLKNSSQKILGICLGMQILFEELEEGETLGLGILPGRVARLPTPSDLTDILTDISPSAVRVPRMGWNNLIEVRESKLLRGIPQDASFYFTHSFVCPKTESDVAYAADPFVIPAVLEFRNFLAAQFHPEKSGRYGSLVLQNFLA
jgi:glutamine amidotransferase